jgi:hypothetical protein
MQATGQVGGHDAGVQMALQFLEFRPCCGGHDPQPWRAVLAKLQADLCGRFLWRRY